MPSCPVLSAQTGGEITSSLVLPAGDAKQVLNSLCHNPNNVPMLLDPVTRGDPPYAKNASAKRQHQGKGRQLVGLCGSLEAGLEGPVV